MNLDLVEYFAGKSRYAVMEDMERLEPIRNLIVKIEGILSDNGNLGFRCLCQDDTCLPCQCHRQSQALLAKFDEMREERQIAIRRLNSTNGWGEGDD